MAREGSFFTIPLVNPSKAEGVFVFNLHFHLEPSSLRETTRAVLDRYNGHVLYAYTPSTPELGSLDLFSVARTTFDVDRMRREGAGIPGVLRTESWFFRGFHDYSGWIDRAVDERIAEGARA